MDLLGNLVGGQGCGPSGVTAAQNPLSKLADDMFQGAQSHPAIPLERARSMPASQSNAIHSMNQGFMEGQMGPHFHGPLPPPPQMPMGRIPPMMQQHFDPAASHAWAQEFSNFRPTLHHPANFDEAWNSNASIVPPESQWVNQFVQMHPHPPHFQKLLPGFESAWQASSGVQTPHFFSRMSNAWIESNPALTAETVKQNPEQNVALEDAWSGGLEDQLGPRDQAVTSDQNFEEAWEAPEKSELEQAWEGPDEAWEGSAERIKKDLLDAWEESKGIQDPELNDVWDQSIVSQSGYDKAWAETAARLEGMRDPLSYQFKANNPYLMMEDPFQAGMSFFCEGEIRQAILAFEAEVQRHEDNSEAWLMLGQSQQENDQDDLAIACLERSVKHDPYNLDALLLLGVSYVNELDSPRALSNLKAWVEHNPLYSDLKIRDDGYSDGTVMDAVMQLMMQAAEHNPADVNVQTVLGVLYNVSRDYDSAVEAFRVAVSLKPESYSLWNKLGATLANSNNSEKALPAYDRALELKPKYARGWLNRGISFANLNNNAEAARCYLKALELNPDARHIWSYLRIVFTCMERFDLVQKASAENFESFKREFEF